MKKFILLLVLLFGVPSLATADTLGCAGGAIIGGGIGSQIGGGPVPVILGIGGALMGCDAGSRIEDGTYGYQNVPVATRTITVVSNDDYTYPYNKRRAYNGISRTNHRQSSYFLEDDYAGPSSREQPKNKTRELTVGNYLESYVDNRGHVVHLVHPSCQTGNHGADGSCLRRFVPALLEMQAACKKDTSALDCNKKPGKAAGEWSRLAEELLLLEKEEMRGVYMGSN